MTTIRILALFATCSLTPVLACSHVQQTAEDCAKQVTPELVGRVDAVLGGDAYETALEVIGKDVALCVLRAAVIAVEKEAAGDSTALSAHDPAANAKIIHAQSWLAAHGGPVPSTIKAGLPGGGHNCCWRSGTWSTIVSPPSCPAPSVPLTPSNLPSHCSCAPVGLWC